MIDARVLTAGLGVRVADLIGVAVGALLVTRTLTIRRAVVVIPVSVVWTVLAVAGAVNRSTLSCPMFRS